MRNLPLWVVVPCCRPEQLPWIFENFDRQVYQDKRLLIVENGPAVGACERYSRKPHYVISSENHVARARNDGIYFVRDHGGGWICMWDDDDWYGPAYLSEVELMIRSGVADVYGKVRNFIGFQEHGLYLFNERNANGYTNHVHGPTIVFRSEDARTYPIVSTAEDVLWCLGMADMGARIWAGTINHYMYLRRRPEDHSWKASPERMMALSQFNDYYYWFGEIDTDLVTGKKPWKYFVKDQGNRRFPRPIRTDEKLYPCKELPPSGNFADVRIGEVL